MPPDPVAALLGLAARQRGAFTGNQARGLGWSERACAASRKEDWTRLGTGVFAHTFIWESFSPRERHLCLTMARVLASRSPWHAARRTAAAAFDLPLLGDDPVEPQLLRDRPGDRVRAKSRHERVADFPLIDRCVVNGLPSSTPARLAMDIARQESAMGATVVADAVLRSGTPVSRLREVATRSAGWPGGLAAMRVAEFADGLSESALESISRVRMDLCGLPRPELQIEVYLGTELLARLDFLWRQQNAVGLADGALKYVNRDDVMAEKWQVERLEDVGLEVARWGWDSAYRETGDLEYKVRRALDRGSRQVLDPRVRFVATTVAQNVATNARAATRRQLSS